MHVMSKVAHAIDRMPPAAAAALRRLGRNLAVARVRRNEPQRVWAERLGISIPTLIRLERGDPRVAMGVYATALWMVGRVHALTELADPVHDHGALELDVRKALGRRRVRAAASAEARLGRKPPRQADE